VLLTIFYRFAFLSFLFYYQTIVPAQQDYVFKLFHTEQHHMKEGYSKLNQNRYLSFPFFDQIEIITLKSFL